MIRCNLCGDRLAERQVAWEGRSKAFNGSMLRGARRRIVLCMDCHAAGEYQQYLAREAEAAKWQRHIRD